MISLLLLINQPYGGTWILSKNLGKMIAASGEEVRLLYPGSKKIKKWEVDGLQIISCDPQTIIDTCEHDTNAITHCYYNTSDGRVDNLVEHFIEKGAPIMLPDHRALNDYIIKNASRIAVICERFVPEVMKRGYEGDIFTLPIPYIRHCSYIMDRKYKAICGTRIAREKNIEWILEANELLPEENAIMLAGRRNMPYVNFSLRKKYPDWEKWFLGSHEDLLLDPVQVYDLADYAVDLSYLPGQEGRAQYSFLEAMEAGNVLIINKKWAIPYGCMTDGKTCIGVSSPEELAACLMEEESPDFIDAYNEVLAIHENCLPQWLEWIYG